MKLLIYSHYFAPSVGGVESIVRSLAAGLAGLRTGAAGRDAREFDITVVTQTPRGDYDDEALAFGVVRRPGLRALWRLVRGADILHLAGPSLTPLMVARLARRPVVLEHHGYQAVCPNGLLIQQPDGRVCPNHFLRRDYAQCYRCAAAEFSVPQGMQMMLLMFPRHQLARRVAANLAISRRVLERCALPHSSVLYYGIEDPLGDAPVTDPGGALAGNARAEREICFAYVGRLVPEKGLPVLLEAVRVLSPTAPPFRVRLIGDGPERARLENIIRRNHLDALVEITGFLSGSALAECLKAVQVVVMPSVWEETAGLAAIEQMMRGQLVIVSDIGGLAEVVGDAGIKVPPGDAPALAAAMERVLRDPSLIADYGNRARERAQRLFARERMIDEHARIYRELAARPRGER